MVDIPENKNITGNCIMKPITRFLGQRIVIGTKSIRVTPDNRPYWQQRGWKKNGSNYWGYYRTRWGSWEGHAVRHSKRAIEFTIKKPPDKLINGCHKHCFILTGKGLYKVHFDTRPKDVDSGIISVEKCIEESFLCLASITI
jgi:hypothetical protein